QVMADACAHRLAPLSEGRIEPKTGCLQCAYHGWEFNSQGNCQRIPQVEENSRPQHPRQVLDFAVRLPPWSRTDTAKPRHQLTARVLFSNAFVLRVCSQEAAAQKMRESPCSQALSECPCYEVRDPLRPTPKTESRSAT
ncbi:unnamed protein product, partial [Effrenium voratum]